VIEAVSPAPRVATARLSSTVIDAAAVVVTAQRAASSAAPSLWVNVSAFNNPAVIADTRPAGS